MLVCEGYKMFKGIMKITRASGTIEFIEGIWLYKPECDCWYCNGFSYPAIVCEISTDNTN